MKNSLHTSSAALKNAAAALCLAALLGAAPADSDLSDLGRWFYTRTGVTDLQQRADGTGIRIAMLDGRVNPNIPDLAGTALSVSEPTFCADVEGGTPAPAASDDPQAQHATAMSSVILGTGAGINGQEGVHGIAPGASLVAYATRMADSVCPPIGAAYRDPARVYPFGTAVADGADIIFVPGNVRVNKNDLSAALRAGTIVLGSAGNDGGEVVDRPAGMNGVVAIGALGPDGERDPDSATGPRMGAIAPGLGFRSIDENFSSYVKTDGASNATAYTAGALALVWSAYPDATGNQILQAMVRTTGGNEHQPERVDDAWGYGIVNPRAMMSVDPTSYPDVNPFLSSDPSLEPTMDEVLGTSTDDPTQPAPSDAPSPSHATEGNPSADADSGGESDAIGTTELIVTGAAVAVAVAITAAALAVFRRRRSVTNHTSQEPGGHHG